MQGFDISMVILIPFIGGAVAMIPFVRGDRRIGLVTVITSVLTLLAAVICFAARSATASWGPLTFRVDGLSEISWWILGYGDQAEVLKPAELRELIADRVDRMAAVYRTRARKKN